MFLRPDSCYFIKEGRVGVRQKIADEMLTVAYLSKGDFFGEEGLLKDARVMPMSPCLMMVF